MNFGLFMMPVHNPEKGLPRTLKEDMHTIIYADELGFDEAWIGEHFTIEWLIQQSGQIVNGGNNVPRLLRLG